MKKDIWCAHCIIDDYVSEAKTFVIDFKKGLLFPKVNNDDSSHKNSLDFKRFDSNSEET